MSVGNSEAATVSLQREQVLLREDVVIHKMNFLAYYFFLLVIPIILVFPGGTCGKEPTCQYRRQRDMGSPSGLGRSPGQGHGNPLQSSCLKNSMGRGAWQATDHGVAESDTTEVT